MFPETKISPLGAVLICSLAFMPGAPSGWSQSALVDRAAESPAAIPQVLEPIDDSNRVSLKGNVHPLAAPHFDKGAVEDSFPAERLLLLLKRSPARERALGDFLLAEHAPGNAKYHHWLEPEEFGRMFGPADADIAATESWLQSHGFSVNKVSAGRMVIEFSGTAGQVREAFHTEIHRFEVNGEVHLANMRDPEIPAALAPVIAGLAPMNDFKPSHYLKVLGHAAYDPNTHRATPDWTYPTGPNYMPSLVVTPGDFAVQYDIAPVYAKGITGKGQSIGIVSASNINLDLVADYFKLFGVSANLPAVVVDGNDPGETDAAMEAYLDVELAGSVAPGAQVILYTAADTTLTSGLALAAYRAVEDDLAGVLSTSYGQCEASLGQSGNAFWYNLWQQAAAQGQTPFVASGDAGSAGCDNFDAQPYAYNGLGVNGYASTPFNVAVGGTDFYYSQYSAGFTNLEPQLQSYWSNFPAGTASAAVSIRQPIPEQVWNDYIGLNAADGGNPTRLIGPDILAGGGGMSGAAVYASSVGTGYAKPAWQAGPGVPADQVRDLPDVSLFAANGNNFSFYPICASPGDCTNDNSAANGGAPIITGAGGTSASSPSMAAIQALVNQSMGSRQGQADYIYYPLAGKAPAAFHDITVGVNRVICSPGTPNCVPGTTGTPSSGFYVEEGYPAGVGYDLASGLGSVDVGQLIASWRGVSAEPSKATLAVNPVTFVHGQAAMVTGSVVAASGSGTPTGSISLTSNDGVSHSGSIENFDLASGQFVAMMNNLPGGTYELTSVYGGDGTFGPSKSAPVAITVTPESAKLTTSVMVIDPSDLTTFPLSAGMEIPYGAQIVFDAQPVGRSLASGAAGEPATGAVTFTDRLGALSASSAQALNSNGIAEWGNGIFAVGSHAVSAAYSGDASYGAASASSVAKFRVIPGSTLMTGSPLANSVAAGSSVAVSVELRTGYMPLHGAMPTGKVQVTLGQASQTVAWSAFGATQDGYLQALVTFSNVPAGILPVTASYSGDSNWQGATGNFGTVTAFQATLVPKVTIAASATHPAAGQLVTLTARVTGNGKARPTGSLVFYGDNQAIYVPATLGANGEVTITLPGGSAQNGSNLITAFYEGDANYSSASSTPIDVTVSDADFSLTALEPQISLIPGKTGTATVLLNPTNGFNAAIQFKARPAAGSGIEAVPAALSAAVSKPTPESIRITLPKTIAPGTYPVVLTASAGSGTVVHTALLLVTVPKP